MVFSWFLSYPLRIDSPTDFVFNHVSVLYWISLSILLASMFLMGITYENYYSNWIISAGIFVVIYSISYFFLTIPTADSNNFTGLTEYFLRTNDLTPNLVSRAYFQWPSFFILAKIMTSVTGIDLAKYEFLLYAIIGFLITTAVYIYASRFSRKEGFVAVIAFTVVMFSFLNYQAAPFSLAFAILLLLFILETKPSSRSSLTVLLLLFVSICTMHAFVALFFILYLLIRAIAGRNAHYRNYFILSLFVYFIVQTNFVSATFGIIIHQLITLPSDYSSYSNIISSRLVPAKVPIDIIAQLFSRGVTISLGLICFLGFISLLAKRKLKQLDIAILLTGIVYSSVGLVLNTVGYRAFPLLFLPVSSGVVYLFYGKLRPYLAGIFLVLLVFVAFIPLHNSFTNYPVSFQTKEEQATSEFLIEKYDWAPPGEILMDTSTGGYVSPQVTGMTEIVDYSSPTFTSNIQHYNCIVYSVGLSATLRGENISLSKILDKFSLIYDSGSSYIAQDTSEHLSR